MRLIKINAPQGKGANIAQTAFSAGINQVSVFQIESHRADGTTETKDSVDIETSTPTAKRFVDALLAADFYDPKDYTINIRQPRSIISRESLRELTRPLVVPASDIYEELWQFSHVTVGFIGRNFIAACLLAYGLIHQQILFNPCRFTVSTAFAASSRRRLRRVDAQMAARRSKRSGICRCCCFADFRRRSCCGGFKATA